jgi:hypothetical protein
MIVSHKLKCIFIKTGKTGGTSFEMLRKLEIELAMRHGIVILNSLLKETPMIN